MARRRLHCGAFVLVLSASVAGTLAKKSGCVFRRKTRYRP